jgi:hypothetical protein
MASLNKFRSKNLLNKSHKLHGQTDSVPHIQIIVRSSVEQRFSNRFNHKDQVGFLMPGKEGHLDIEYPFEHGKMINYTFDGVSIHPVSTKKQASFLTQLPERKETAQ